jgi:hypothetical protein
MFKVDYNFGALESMGKSFLVDAFENSGGSS